ERDRQSRTCSLARNLLGTLRRENIWMKKLISAGLIAGLALSLLPAAFAADKAAAKTPKAPTTTTAKSTTMAKAPKATKATKKTKKVKKSKKMAKGMKMKAGMKAAPKAPAKK
ncbi:MAG TPA: hypothetical protein VGN26_00920, partial [Armatimonadota bacterium]